MRTKHMKPNAENQNGGIVTQEDYIDASNVMISVKGEVTRVGYKEDKNGNKVRYAKKTGEELD